MIVVKRKPIKEILEFVKNSKNILIAGCGTCAAVCLEGGEKEAAEIKGLLNLHFKNEDKNISALCDSAVRLCDPEFVKDIKLKCNVLPDVIISLGCGAGVQMVSDIFESVPVFPGINTTFLGTNDELGVFSEKCQGCGECILDKTGGICPVSRCSKSLLNGPCGGSSDGKCEVDDTIDCAWQLIFDRLKTMNMLDKMQEIIPVKDWRTSRDGGVRAMVKEEAVIDKNEE
ncbi:MAG: methylenetetrahydrofolate reductase C-terminal domain-containing protein [Victivallales bacterium]|nr:methylenetetrahydrofolate reductase C-terminal domain-containing protein [Victivallales bacterium]MCF7888862.1 methylenetetrahydrofolate reductase C-terminal domain-containing protein [Victivallales bacterium]